MKLIKESIEHTFIRGGKDKLSNLGLGKREIVYKWLLDNYTEKRIDIFTINDDFSIDAFGDIFIRDFAGNLPEFIQFRNIYGSFSCTNSDLTTLRGGPVRVTGDYFCNYNKMKTLDFAPMFVGGDFSIEYNELKMIEIALFANRKPHIGGTITFGGREISGRSFINGFFENYKPTVHESFIKSNDKLSNIGVGKITLIKKWLEDDYGLQLNKYTLRDDLSIDVGTSITLPDGFGNLPDYIQFHKIDGNVNFEHCGLTTLKGSPKIVTGGFYIANNNLTSLDFAPRKIMTGSISCGNNNIPKEEIQKYIDSKPKISGYLYSDYKEFEQYKIFNY
jgi:hypothetical protein